jgi:hypothetical protein
MKKNDLMDRLFHFAIDVLRMPGSIKVLFPFYLSMIGVFNYIT